MEVRMTSDVPPEADAGDLLEAERRRRGREPLYPPDRRELYRHARGFPEADFYLPGDPRLALSDEQFQALASAARGNTAQNIAKNLGMSPARISGWFGNETFLAAVDRERQQPTTRQFARDIRWGDRYEANEKRLEAWVREQRTLSDEEGVEP